MKSFAQILLVDDDPLILKTTRLTLEAAGYAVSTAATGAEGLQMAETQLPDLLLLDMILPDLAGSEVCRRLKADPATARIFVVLTSALKVSGDDQAAGLDTGADGYIARPISNRELVARVAALLRIQRAEETLRTYAEHLEEMVTARTRALAEAQERLLRQERLIVLGQLAGSIAHELRTPLGAIKNSAYLLTMILEDPNGAVQETLAILDREIQTSEQIINNLLDFARTRQPQRRPVDVNRIVQQSLAWIDAPDGVRVQQDLADLPPIAADPGQLEQILKNLLLNAVQAMPDGGRLTLKTRYVPPAWVTVEIVDTGVGIPPQNLARLFEPLFTTKPKGIGLGLALTKMLIEGHGGQIAVESQVGQGSTFTVSLPVAGMAPANEGAA